MKTNHPSCAPLVSVLCSATAEHAPSYLEKALAFQLEEAEGQVAVPDWVQIFPKGPELATMDGRKFKMSDPDAFVASQNTSSAMPIMVDYDHLSSFAPEENGDQTAAGWIEELEVRDGQVWARVVWTVRASKQIAEREWRFVSPEFMVNKQTKEVAQLDALALVNRPAFQMKALAHRTRKSNGDPDMKAIAKALGLSDDATEEQILTAISTQQSELASAKASKNTPSTTEFMPRADYDRVLARAEEAEGKLGEADEAARKGEVETMIASAVTAGKIAPASKAYYMKLAMASDEGFEDIKNLCSTLPKLGAGQSESDDDLDTTGLSEEDRELCRSMDIAPEEFAKTRAAERAETAEQV